MKLYILALASGLLATGCATTGEPSEATARNAAEVRQMSPDGEVLICRVRRTGSRLPQQRECRTEDEWAQVEAQSQELVRDFQRAPQRSPY
ncbi:hypothetical protein [Maricaulis sp.]|uniref:hypothetical protein n=1 Tax=Maricaulis sp. TaxID=1486257 RepID=UPI00262FC149|nr:hypothetical protein [Maricaulis sp.]